MKIKGITIIPGSLSGLDPEFAAKWLDKLENGGLKQAKEVLHDLDTDGFCCLGVACEVAVADGIIDTIKDVTGSARYGTGIGYLDVDDVKDYCVSILPKAVVERYGFPDNDPTVGVDPTLLNEVTLSNLNDDYDLSFKQIAKVIRYAMEPVDG